MLRCREMTRWANRDRIALQQKEPLSAYALRFYRRDDMGGRPPVGLRIGEGVAEKILTRDERIGGHADDVEDAAAVRRVTCREESDPAVELAGLAGLPFFKRSASD
jgi:hypothetical protein